MIDCFVAHRREVVIRRTKFDLAKAEERAHILQGLKIALDNIDAVIALIKAAKDVESARTGLMKTFGLSERQAQAILDMQLQRLTNLEVRKVIEELAETLALIESLKALLASEAKILGVVKDETKAIAEKHGDGRRTEILDEEAEEINVEDLITREDMVILISNRGYIKRIPVAAYRRQGRGGKGSSSTVLKDDDFIEQLFVASTHDYVLFITSKGKSYWVKVHEIPESSRQAKGQSIKVLLSIGGEEEITTIVNLHGFDGPQFVFMATRRGVVKKVPVADFANARTRGIVAIHLDEGDALVKARLTSGSDEMVLVTRKGWALRFPEKAVRAMGRASRGVSGIKLSDKDELAGVAMVRPGEQLLVVSEFGYGKRTRVRQLRPARPRHARPGGLPGQREDRRGRRRPLGERERRPGLHHLAGQHPEAAPRRHRGARQDRHGRAHRQHHPPRPRGRRGARDEGRRGRRARGRGGCPGRRGTRRCRRRRHDGRGGRNRRG